MNKRDKSPIAAAVRAVLLTAPGIATVHAQQAQSPPALQEVEIYGKAEQYRPEDQTTATGLNLPLIDTPQSISVISDEMLKLWDAKSAYDAADMVPGVSAGGQAFGEDRLYLRGQLLSQPRVNGVNAPTGQYLDSFALDRIEFVRGPATVLYGVTASFGGEVNQILKRPLADFHAAVGFQDGDFARRRFEADVTGAVPGTDDRLKVRAVVAYTKSGIQQDLVVPDNNISRLYSGALEYDVTERTIASVYVYKEDKTFDPDDGCPLAQSAANVLYIPSIPVKNWYCNDPKQSHDRATNELELGKISHKFANDWTLAVDASHDQYVRGSSYVFGFGPAGAYGLSPQDVYLYGYTDRTTNNVGTSDVTLSGDYNLFERTNQFFAAVEFQNTEINHYNYTTYGLGVMNMFTDGGKGILADGAPIPLIPSNPTYVGDQYSRNKQLRESAQTLLHPIGRLDVLAGVLVQHTDQTENNIRVASPSTYASLTETDTVYRAGLTYGLFAEKGPLLTEAKPYLSFSEGVYPNVGVFDANGNALTAPQKMKSYEGGLKTQWINGSIDANIDVYYSDVTNVPEQIFGNVGTSGGTFSSVLGGDHIYRGVEFETLGEVLPGWNVALAYTYTNNSISTELFPGTLAVANVPKWQASIFTSYEFLGGPLKGLIVGAAVVDKHDVPLVDSAHAIFAGHYSTTNQVTWSATRYDFRASYKNFNGHLNGLEIAANVYNAFNVRTYNSVDVSGEPGFGNAVGNPRTITVSLRYHY